MVIATRTLPYLVAFLISLVVSLVGARTAEATRKAFVVGNSRYAHASNLANPANDARDIASRLTALGYQVTLEIDVARNEFLPTFQSFVRGLARGDLALLYYAGHGLQIGGENYLFPVDARLELEADARARLVPLNALLAERVNQYRGACRYASSQSGCATHDQ